MYNKPSCYILDYPWSSKRSNGQTISWGMDYQAFKHRNRRRQLKKYHYYELFGYPDDLCGFRKGFICLHVTNTIALDLSISHLGIWEAGVCVLSIWMPQMPEKYSWLISFGPNFVNFGRTASICIWADAEWAHCVHRFYVGSCKS